MIVILGAGGAIGSELAKIYAARNTPVRLVSRNPKRTTGADVFAADLADREQAIRAVTGATTVYLLVGLQYDLKVWQELWPRIMANTIEACKRAKAKLVFFDNVYMYGKVAGPMLETTAYAPCSKKGEIRAQVAIALMGAAKAGDVTAMIARSADFYGPATQNSLLHALVFDAFANGKKASWLVNDSVPHSFTFVPDAARGLTMLAERESAWNQVWHLPTAPDPPTGRDLVAMAAKEFHVPPRHRVLSRPLLRLAGWFNRVAGESYEMLCQYDSPYVFDSTKFAKEFGFAGTPYPEGVRIAAESYKRS